MKLGWETRECTGPLFGYRNGSGMYKSRGSCAPSFLRQYQLGQVQRVATPGSLPSRLSVHLAGHPCVPKVVNRRCLSVKPV